ncbi:hypothetical protein SAMN02745146_0875 [Hymenobacter daecheongensis DSM 21074]|uniref:Uncharacterized protein n=1 Tax=Hymenobacter daecheongensis DSM 21074 TaxID=1121955 RepID=A0A1M6B5L5_9BACT|nr:hypothetical protein [Hymenobacter daecheongensis]SHI43753.1 hypothetical protein SAMN02745146_0875 [Hymenobacter daecheongensis DSM 21074]
MPIFDNLAKAAKDFFVEEDESQPAAAPAARPLPGPAAPPATGPNPAAYHAPAPVVSQPEQRHLDHISGLLAGDGKDFVAFVKMVKSMAASGLSGPVLYRTAFNAFSAMTGLDLPTLLASAEQFETRLTADRNKVLERHQEKLGEIRIPNAPPGPIVQLLSQEQQLQKDLAELSRQLEDKRQLLLTAQQQLQQERQKAQTALASYELASATATADLHAHRQAAQSFLTSSTPTA